MKLARYFKYLKFLIAFLIPVAVVMVFNNGLDNDSWYVLAEGKEIVQNGVYYTDQLSMHEGLDVTVQNYGFAVIYYWLFSTFGGIGIYIAMLILNLGLCYLIYKICMLISNKNINLSLLLMILTDCLLATGFVVTRAQMVSYIIVMLVIYLLELYVRERKAKTLWIIPILSLVQINLHGAMWPMMFAIMIIYMIDSIKQPRFNYKGYKIKPILMVFVVALLVGFLNPYGIKMMTYILTSFGVSEANNYINEMKPFNLSNNVNILLYVMIVATLVLYIYGKNKNIRLRYLLLLFGFLGLGINNIKGMSYLILVLLFPLAEIYKDIKIEKWGSRKIRWMMTTWVGIFAVAIVISYTILMLPQIRSDGPSEEMVAAMNKLDSAVGDANKDELRVYSNYDEGGYVEYRGYKPYIDPRMEVFLKINNGKEDIFAEYFDLQNGDIKAKDFLKKYDFDYLVIREADILYDDTDNLDDKYKMIYMDDDDGEEDEKYGVKVYVKADKISERFTI